MSKDCVCVYDDLRHWDLLKSLSDGDWCNVKAFCVFRAHGGTAALLISDDDEVYGICSELTEVSLLGVSPDDGIVNPEPSRPFKISPLSGKGLQAFFIGVIVGASLDLCGRLYWWGKTGKDQNIIQPPQLASFKVEPSPSFIQVCCGHSFMAALSTEGKVYVWGRLIYSWFEAEELVVGSPVVSLACGAVHVVMLTSDGSVYTWGSGFDGQRGYLAFTEKDSYTVTKIELDGPCLSLVCGPVSTLMLLKSGDVWACGDNSEDLGFLGVDSKMKKIKIATRISLNQKAVRIFSAWLSPKPYACYIAILEDNTVYTWGPHFPPKLQREGSRLIEAFYNNCTPRELGMIYLNRLGNKENLSCSIEVLSNFESSCNTPTGDPDLLSIDSSYPSTSDNMAPVKNSSCMMEFSAKLFGSSRLSDITFAFKNSNFPGHRLFLCSRSQRFRETLDLDVPAQALPVMDCRSEDPVAFKGLLQYLYTGQHNVQELPQLLELHRLALIYDESQLVKDTANEIFYLLGPDNLQTVVEKARAIQSSALTAKCESFITYLSVAKPCVMAKLFMDLANKTNAK